ncbi:MAG: helix-turn-helix transcriptional regulator [Pseudomonadota bacterium]
MTSALPSLTGEEPSDLERWNSLTDQEHQMLSLAAAPMSNKAVAARLDVSERTVERAIRAAGSKLGVPKGQGKQPTLRAYREFGGRVGKPDVGFAPLEKVGKPGDDRSQDVIEIPLAAFDKPDVRRAIEQELFASRLEALDAQHGVGLRVAAIILGAVGIAIAGTLVTAVAILLSTLLNGGPS